jgi:hypothetical protein
MKTTHMNLQRLSQDVYQGRQSWCYKAIWKYGDERLQVYIERDSYDFQSYVSVCIWSRAKQEWSPLAELHISHAECRRISSASANITAADFGPDETTLLGRALEVIG